MNEAERCDRILLMHAGQVLVGDTPAALNVKKWNNNNGIGIYRLSGRRSGKE